MTLMAAQKLSHRLLRPFFYCKLKVEKVLLPSQEPLALGALSFSAGGGGTGHGQDLNHLQSFPISGVCVI